MVAKSNPQYEDESQMRLIEIDIINLTIIFVVFIVFISLFAGYFYWWSAIPDNGWVLAVEEDNDKMVLQAINLTTNNKLVLGESEGNWVPTMHLAYPPPSLISSVSPYSGYWEGGTAVYLSKIGKVVFTLIQNEVWQVSTLDLKTGVLESLVKDSDVEPFISIAPDHALTAVSLPATEETDATLSVFSGSTKLDLPLQDEDSVQIKGILSPDGKQLLYSSTLEQDDRVPFKTTLYSVNLESKNSETVYSFDHHSGFFDVEFDFTPNSEKIVYVSEDSVFYQSNLIGEQQTSVFTPTENILVWRPLPDSENILIIESSNQDGVDANLFIVSTESSEVLPLAEIIDIRVFFTSIKYINGKLFFSPSDDQQIIYDLPTEDKLVVSESEARFGPTLVTKDKYLVSFVANFDSETILSFFNPYENKFVPSLNSALSRRGNFGVFDIATKYVLFYSGSNLYLQDVTSRRFPITIEAGQDNYSTAQFSNDMNNVLYTAVMSDTYSIYMYSIGGDSKLLAKDAQQLTPFYKVW